MFLFISNLTFGQNLLVGQVFDDSLSVLKNVNWELSKAKYYFGYGYPYQVFLDKDKNEAFLIMRKRKQNSKDKFVQVFLK